MLATIMAALAALPEIAKVLGELVSVGKGLRQDSIDKSLDIIKKDVAETLFKIQGAKTNEERSKLAIELSNRISK